jgi:hypothetical protein
MSSTDSGPEADSSEVHSYFQRIEEVFVQLRGAPLLLSPADWQVARKWYQEGIPLEVVRRSLEQVFERRRERKTRGRIQSLRYCAPAVEAAWGEIRELTAAGRRPVAAPIDLTARLQALAAALPPHVLGYQSLVQSILGLSGDTEEVEAELDRLDAKMLEAAEEGLGENARQEIEQAVARTLADLSERLPEAEIEASRVQLWRQALRRRLDLPILSLFSPAAEEDPD